MKMDKKAFSRLEKTLKDIKTKLLLNTDIRKLLYYTSLQIGDQYDSIATPSVQDVKDNIFLQPIADVDTTPPFDKSIYLTLTAPSISVSQMEFGELGLGYIIKVMLMVDRNNWTYDDNKIRSIKLLGLIVDELDDFKFEFSHALSLKNIVETITTKRMMGYSMIFIGFDGVGELDGDK